MLSVSIGSIIGAGIFILRSVPGPPSGWNAASGSVVSGSGATVSGVCAGTLKSRRTGHSAHVEEAFGAYARIRWSLGILVRHLESDSPVWHLPPVPRSRINAHLVDAANYSRRCHQLRCGAYGCEMPLVSAR